MKPIKMDNSITTIQNQALSRLHFIKKYISVANLIKMLVVLWLCFFIFTKSTLSQQEDSDTLAYVESPKVDDIYFLDFRAITENLRPQERYRIAKVVDITGEVVTLVYGNMFYFRHQAAIDSIHYGQLRIKKYFETKRNDFTFAQLKRMHIDEAIYLIKRPEQNMLYGNYINEPTDYVPSSHYTPGKRENSEGLSFLSSTYIEDNLEQAFDRFTRSADVGFAQGQVNLGQMYLNGQHVNKDLPQAMYWFKQAALQSEKTGILKYVIVCRQVSYCHERDFFQELTQAGVNIKVRDVALKLKNDINT